MLCRITPSAPNPERNIKTPGAASGVVLNWKIKEIGVTA
jgi:hypothetical protein